MNHKALECELTSHCLTSRWRTSVESVRCTPTVTVSGKFVALDETGLLVPKYTVSYVVKTCGDEAGPVVGSGVDLEI